MDWVAVTLVFVGAALFVYLHPDTRKARAYRGELAAREPVPDADLFRRFFVTGEVEPDTPGRVRSVFAEHTGYPADRLLPDDDLMFFWRDLDAVDLIRDLEAEFGVALPAEHTARTACTIRAVARLVDARRAEPHAAADRGLTSG